MDSMRRNAQKMMPHIMAMNKKPDVGMKNNRQPKPGVSNLTAYAKGGAAKHSEASEKKMDKAQDKSMMERHNTLMHPGQKSKLKCGGKVQKYAEGKKVKKPATPEPFRPLTSEDKKKIKQGINPYPGRSEDMGMKKGGKVKGDKKKVMGTVGEAKALMNALKKARRPATPMPGTAPGLGMAPPMAPPMKKGGKVMKRASGGSAKHHSKRG